MSSYIVYEQPLSERIRVFLRLEYLFDRISYHERGGSSWDSAAVLSSIFDVKTILSRSDLKIDIVKELDRQAVTLGKLTKNPKVDRQQLDKTLKEFEHLAERLYTLPHCSVQKRNEFLNTVQQKGCISGGACVSDLPIYHFWLMQSAERRRAGLMEWQQGFDVIRQAITLILRTIRNSGMVQDEVAKSGFYQCTLDVGASPQLVRIFVPEDQPCYAEISGSKHRFSVRFMMASMSERSEQTPDDVEFQLSCCLL